jgi:hypothetical protein
MAQVTITVPDAIANRVLEAVCSVTGYDGVGTKLNWAKAQIIKQIKVWVKQYETQQAIIALRNSQENAQSAVDSDVESNINLS